MNKILIADEHGIVRLGIKTLILENLPVSRIDEAGNENETVNLVKSSFYDLIILDINMPDSDFVKLMHWLSVTTPKTRTLVFSMYPENIYAERCLQLGAKGFLHKAASNEEIIYAMKKVLNGKVYINEAFSDILERNNDKDKIRNPFHKLSSRELEIAALINKGHSLPEICNILSIQYSTANTYKRRIFEKLTVQNALALSRLMRVFDMEV
jgi:two-component system invasion response regulator UvrY